MSRRIKFINPFGSPDYDDVIEKTLKHYCASETEIHIEHLDNAPADIDYFYSKHIAELAIFETIMRAEEQGYNAVIVGCLYDPGVRVARELVDIPVIGPLEASLQTASYFGHSTLLLADHRKAAAYMSDLVRLNKQGDTVCGIDTIEWFVRDMIRDRGAVAKDIIRKSKEAAERHGAETVLMSCTIIAAIYQEYIMDGGTPSEVPIINPNIMALKMAESMADLHKAGGYFVARKGYYEKPSGHYEAEFKNARSVIKRLNPSFGP